MKERKRRGKKEKEKGEEKERGKKTSLDDSSYFPLLAFSFFLSF